MTTYLKHHKRVRARIRRYLRETLTNKGVFLQITTAKNGNYAMMMKGKLFGRIVDVGDPARVSTIAADLLTMPVLVEVILPPDQFIEIELTKPDHLGKQGRGRDYMVFGFKSMTEAAQFRMLHPDIKFLPMRAD